MLLPVFVFHLSHINWYVASITVTHVQFLTYSVPLFDFHIQLCFYCNYFRYLSYFKKKLLLIQWAKVLQYFSAFIQLIQCLIESFWQVLQQHWLKCSHSLYHVLQLTLDSHCCTSHLISSMHIDEDIHWGSSSHLVHKLPKECNNMPWGGA